MSCETILKTSLDDACNRLARAIEAKKPTTNEFIIERKGKTLYSVNRSRNSAYAMTAGNK